MGLEMKWNRQSTPSQGVIINLLWSEWREKRSILCVHTGFSCTTCINTHVCTTCDVLMTGLKTTELNWKGHMTSFSAVSHKVAHAEAKVILRRDRPAAATTTRS
jgi:hypothetical protein